MTGAERLSTSSVVSKRFIAEIEHPKCRFFDSVWPKAGQTSAQDDNAFVMRTSDSALQAGDAL